MKFHISFFVIGLVLGFIITILKSPEIQKYIRYPSPYNAGKIVYQGLGGDCYKVKAIETSCSDKSVKQPIL